VILDGVQQVADRGICQTAIVIGPGQLVLRPVRAFDRPGAGLEPCLDLLAGSDQIRWRRGLGLDGCHPCASDRGIGDDADHRDEDAQTAEAQQMPCDAQPEQQEDDKQADADHWILDFGASGQPASVQARRACSESKPQMPSAGPS